jgi:hypothetical protein
MMKRKWFFWGPMALLGLIAFIFIGGTVVMLLWNWLLPPLFGWAQLTFWQALGILALSRILFGRFGMPGGPRHMRHRMFEHWDRMSPEERERFRQGIGPFGESKVS